VTTPPGETPLIQKTFYHVEIIVDGQQVVAIPVAAYTIDMAIVRALVPELLYRVGLMEPPGTPGPPGHPDAPTEPLPELEPGNLT